MSSITGETPEQCSAQIISELSGFKGGWHDLPPTDPAMSKLESRGLVVWEGFWSPTIQGVDLARKYGL